MVPKESAVSRIKNYSTELNTSLYHILCTIKMSEVALFYITIFLDGDLSGQVSLAEFEHG